MGTGASILLGGREPLVLWGDVRFALPDWFTSRFPARYVHARLFDWPDEMLASKTVVTPAGMPDGTLLTLKPHG